MLPLNHELHGHLVCWEAALGLTDAPPWCRTNGPICRRLLPGAAACQEVACRVASQAAQHPGAYGRHLAALLQVRLRSLSIIALTAACSSHHGYVLWELVTQSCRLQLAATFQAEP